MEDKSEPKESNSLLDGRYSLLKKLGEGGKGMVYKAHDNMLDRVVAIKMLKSETFDEETHARFMREAQSAARLNHPNIVSMYDVGKDKEDGRYFLVMEFVSGSSLRGLLESQGKGPEKGIEYPTILRVSTDVCKALDYAHSRGVLHRDVKPENIMVTEDGTAKLMDFGLAKALDKPRLTREGIMVGTPAYMAPENALGRESDARSDIYSLGCVLYEMIVGSPPFAGEDSLKTIYSHIHDMPVPPSRINHGVPLPLEAIVIKAIMKDPMARFPSAYDFLRAVEQVPSPILGSGKSEVVGTGVLEDPAAQSSQSKFVHTPDLRRALPLIDRETELASLKSFLDVALRREGTVVFLAGEAGIGKTRLAEELRTYATLRGAIALSGRCLQESAPYSPWVEIIRGLVSQASPQLLLKASGTYSDEIAKLVPEVLEKIGRLPSSQSSQFSLAGQAEQDQIRFFESITQFFLNLSRESPLLLLLDDLNSADAPSIQLLRQVTRRIQGESIMIIGTYRDSDLAKTAPLFQLTLDLNRERLLNTIHLKPFDIRSLTHMIAETFGETDEQQTSDFRDMIFEKTGGNPFFVEEVLRSLVEQGVIYRTEKGWTRKRIEEIEVPPTVKAVIEQRLTRVDEESLTVLTAASLMAREFSFELLQRVTGLDEEALLKHVEKILKSRLLSEKKLVHGESVYAFADLQVRNVLQEGISLVRRRKYHLKVGQAIEELYKDRKEEKASELAHHFLEGNDVEKALQYCVKAGERAAAIYAHDEACSEFKIALELLDEKDDRTLRSHVLERFADELWAGDKVDLLLKYYGEAAKICESTGELRRAGEIYLKMMSVYETVLLSKSGTFEYADKALKLLSGGPPSEALAYLYVGLGQAYWWSGEREMAAEMHSKGLELAKQLNDHRAEAFSYSFSCYMVPISEKEKGLEYARKGVEIAREHNLLFHACYGYAHLAEVHLLVKGDCKKSEQIVSEMSEYARKVGYSPGVSWGQLELAAFEYPLMGEWKKAKVIGDDLFKSFHSLDPLVKAHTLGILGNISRCQGELEIGEGYLKEMLPLVKGFNEYQFIMSCYVPLGRLAMGRNDLEQAESYLRYGYELTKSVGLTVETSMPFVLALTAIIELRLKQERTDEARQSLKELWEAAEEIDEEWARAYTYRAEGALASSERDWEKAISSFGKSADGWKKLAWPYEEAKTLHELGAAYQEKGDMRDASESFNNALEIFTRLGASLDVKRVLARKELLKA